MLPIQMEGAYMGQSMLMCSFIIPTKILPSFQKEADQSNRKDLAYLKYF
jgi:hypothetical protein